MTTEQLALLFPLEQRSAAVAVLATLAAVADAAKKVATPTPTSLESAEVDDEKRAKFRAALVRDIWEPDLRSELVDRIVDAWALRLFDVPALKAAVKRAKNRKADYERTEGARGKDSIWKTLATWLKGVYESNGLEWKPTAAALERRPIAPKLAVLEDADEESDLPPGRLNMSQLKQLVDGARKERKEKANAK